MPRTQPNWLLVALLAFVLAAVFVDPLREMTLEDDWAYAHTVRGILEQGKYTLSPWAAANMPFQAYWGAMFAGLAGYSLAILRVSTLVLALAGMFGFYGLAREHDFTPRQAGLLALMWITSPLIFRFSFNFMTDVPFMSLLVIALWLYSRALRTGTMGTFIAASVAAAAAILTRQFGAALVGGMVVLWLTDRRSRERTGAVAVGLLLPGAATIWQLYAGLQNATWAQGYVKVHMGHYFGDLATLATHWFWRPAIILEYLALFSLPLVLVLAVALLKSRREHGDSGAGRWVLLFAALGTYILCALLLAHEVLGTPRLMPLVPWNFDVLGRGGKPGAFLVTAVVTLGAFILAWGMLRGYRRSMESTRRPLAVLLLGWTTLFLLLLTLIFYKIGDEYIFVFLPFALLVAASAVRPYLDRYALYIAGASLLLLLGASLWTREYLSMEEALFIGGERFRSQGVPVRSIDAGWNWACYNGALEEYLTTMPRMSDESSDKFFEWYRAKRSSRTHVVAVVPPKEGSGWEVVGTVPYQTIILRERMMYLARRVDSH